MMKKIVYFNYNDDDIIAVMDCKDGGKRLYIKKIYLLYNNNYITLNYCNIYIDYDNFNIVLTPDFGNLIKFLNIRNEWSYYSFINDKFKFISYKYHKVYIRKQKLKLIFNE